MRATLENMRFLGWRFVNGKIAEEWVFTTGFHFREVRNLLKDMPVPVDFVVTRMSPQTGREMHEVHGFDKHSKFGSICRDQSSIVVYKDLLKSELDIASELECCTLSDKKMVESMLKKMDVLLAKLFKENA